jgi:hypothetical protein
MQYDFAITIPPNTPANAPQETGLQLTAGIVHSVWIVFPPGCAGLAHVQIKQPEATFLPSNPEGSFAGDSCVIPIVEYKPLIQGGDMLKAFCWNLDDTYPHTVTIRLGVLLEEQLVAEDKSLGILQRIYRTMFGSAGSIISAFGLWR